MPEYIEREALIEFVKQNTPNINGETTIECIERAIRAMPAADVVEVKHGRWVEEGCGLLVCSKCNFEYDHSGVPFEGLYYCPNCGARMDGERKDGEENGM